MKSEQDKAFFSNLAEEEKRQLNIQLLRTHLQQDAVLAGRTATSDNARINMLRYVNDTDQPVLRAELDKPLKGRVGGFWRDSSARRRTLFLYDSQRDGVRLVIPPTLNEARIEMAVYEENRKGWGPTVVTGSKWKTFADENRNSEVFGKGIEHFTKLRNGSHRISH